MSTYILSDLHGCLEALKNMLNLINFSDNDELYILGDIFDRGPNPLGILDFLAGKKNVFLLKGNHELMYEQAYEDPSNLNLHYCNGGQITQYQISERGQLYADSLYQFIKKLPIFKVINNKYILVHSDLEFKEEYLNLDIGNFLAKQDFEKCLWNRENIDNEKQFKDYIVIGGHTPTPIIKGENKIIKQNSHIYIDCGCCFSDGQLGCLRLEDFKEFYVEGGK